MNKSLKKLSVIARRLYIIVGALGFAALSVITTYIKPLNSVDYIVSDYIYQAVYKNIKKEQSNIKIIVIDNETEYAYGEYSLWSRSRMANLIKKLNKSEYSPKVIALGLDYHNERDSDGDSKLAKVCGNYGNVCVGITAELESDRDKKNDEAPPLETKDTKKLSKNSDTSKDNEDTHEGVPDNTMAGNKIVDVYMPYDELSENVSTGVLNVNNNSVDGYVRNIVAGIKYNENYYDSFSLAVYKMYLKKDGGDYENLRVDNENSFGINFSRNVSHYDTYSFVDVMKDNVDLSVFKNSIVLIGDSTVNGDLFNLPNHKDEQAGNIDIQANAINALLQQNTMQYIERWFLAIWYALFAAAFFIVTSYSGGISAVFQTLLLIAMQVLTCALLNFWGWYVPLLQLIIIIVVITLVSLFVGYMLERRRKAVLENMFKKYVDEQVVNEIVNENGIIDITKVGGERKDIAVLFVDIRGFTTLSESLAPEQVVDILNNYLSIIADAVAVNGGTLDKFIGDAAMAVYNSPSDIDDYVFRAVCTAWDILSGAEELEDMCKKKYGKDVTFGIGVHCGEAVVGNIGSRSRMDYTAIGDTVNTTSRLEGAAKSGQILVSSAVLSRLGNRIASEFAGEYTLKGKKNPVPAYELTGINDAHEEFKRSKKKIEIIGEKFAEIKEFHGNAADEISRIGENTVIGLKELADRSKNIKGTR